MRTFRFTSLALSTAIFLSCGGGEGGTTPLEPTPITVSPPTLTIETTNTIPPVSMLVAKAGVDNTGTVVNGTYTWKVNGEVKPSTTSELSAPLPPGSYSVCFQVKVGSVTSNEACTLKVLDDPIIPPPPPPFAIKGKLVVAGPGSDLVSVPHTVCVGVDVSLDCAASDSQGNFSVLSAKGSSDSLCITVDISFGAAVTTGRTFYPAEGCIKKKDFAKDQVFILAPLTWNNIEINLFKGFDSTGTAPVAGKAFYLTSKLQGGLVLRSKTWKQPSIPIAIARTRSDLSISQSQEDSVRKLVIAKNTELGSEFFKFVSFADLNVQSEVWEGLTIKVLTTVSSRFHTYQFSGNYISQGEISLSSFEALLNGNALSHELGHSIGAGHTQAWFSLMNNNPGCMLPNFGGPCTSFEKMDVAHILLLYRVRELQEKYQTSFGLLEILQGQRTRMMGLAREPIYRP